MTPTQAKDLADKVGISYTISVSRPYPTVKQLQKFGKGAALRHANANKKLAEELRAVVEWAQIEKAPLRQQEIARILKVLADHAV